MKQVFATLFVVLPITVLADTDRPKKIPAIPKPAFELLLKYQETGSIESDVREENLPFESASLLDCYSNSIETYSENNDIAAAYLACMSRYPGEKIEYIL